MGDSPVEASCHSGPFRNMIAIMFSDLAPLLKGLDRRHLGFQPGETVFRQGDPVRYIFMVTGGAIDLLRHQASGASLVLQHAGPGTMLAEASIDSPTYHCAAVAVSSSTAWAVSKREFLNRLAQNPTLALALIRHFAHELQNARFHAEILSMKTVAERLDAWIAWRGPLPSKGQWVRLAAELGVSPESLYREIAKRN
ncbi:Crp/Fnr family transcriptional regulator [Bradyrhizobium guangzhouense]|nr:Crp/Fnr family transcriptional regulator [Bradyrhizobium guangzhouense]